MEVTDGDEDYDIVCVKKSGLIRNVDDPGTCYVAMKYPEGDGVPYPNTVFSCEMHFKTRTIDIGSGQADEDVYLYL